MNSFALLDDEDEASPMPPTQDEGGSSAATRQGGGAGKVEGEPKQPDLHLGPQWARDGGKYSPPKSSSPRPAPDTEMWTEAGASKRKKGASVRY